MCLIFVCFNLKENFQKEKKFNIRNKSSATKKSFQKKSWVNSYFFRRGILGGGKEEEEEEEEEDHLHRKRIQENKIFKEKNF